MLACGALALLWFSDSPAQTVHKYRDASGQWVFTDQGVPPDVSAETLEVAHADTAVLHLAVERIDQPGSTELVAVNDCLCVASFEAQVQRSDTPEIPVGSDYRATLAAQSRQVLLHVTRATDHKPQFTYAWRSAVGSPDAVHRPTRPYRVPFGVGSTYLITQTFPDHMTHLDAESAYAVDFALPDGTPVYAAREGVVINARHDAFRGAADAALLDQANKVQILHDDGTIALYAHLHWDSIRVHIGERVVRGQYIADSGSTGFSSGPHLHFAVVRNAGVTNESVPVQFEGLGGAAVTPVTNRAMRGY